MRQRGVRSWQITREIRQGCRAAQPGRIVDDRIDRNGGVSLFPAMMIVAKIGQRGEEPRGYVCINPQAVTLLIEPNEDGCDEIVRVRGILHVPIGVADERSLPGCDQTIQRGRVTLLQGDEAGAVGDGIVGHRRGAALSRKNPSES